MFIFKGTLNTILILFLIIFLFNCKSEKFETEIKETKTNIDTVLEQTNSENLLEYKDDKKVPTTKRDILKRYDAVSFFDYDSIVNEKRFVITESQTIKNGDYSFKINFQKEGNLKDECYNGELNLWLGDYNLDGFLDFKMLKACGKGWFYKYYLFNNAN